ncbi:MAG: penicillin acylase family protein [Bacillota bacterium]
MLRLFSYAGALIVLNIILALVTGSLVLRITLFAISLVVIGLYWFLRRSLPPISGTLSIEGLREPVEVYRDERGVPHLYARNLHDLYLAQGYVTAQDRIWQMEVSRRAASGRLAEILGERSLERDRHARTVGLRRVAEASVAAHSPSALACLEAYAAGVNAFLKEGRLPPEFTLLRARPEPWTVVDSIAVAKLLAYELSNNWADELFRAQLVQVMGAEKAADLFCHNPDQASLEALGHLALPYLDDLFALAITNLETVSGSNGWVVGGGRTRSGHPMLGSDLHAAPRIPTPWHQAHLVGPDRLDVAGIAFPGMPGIVFGHTRDFAWSLSSLTADTQDLVLERANPEAPDQVEYQGRWEQATRLSEPILVRGRPEPVPHEVLITRHGPILAHDGSTAIALRSAVLQPSAETECLLNMNRARTWAEFRQAARGFRAPAQAVLFAGRDGTIARMVVGSLPIRRMGDGQLPAPGWTGSHEWEGFIPPDELPEDVNPPEGFLVAANQDLTPPGYPYRICSPWAPPYRAQRLTDRLRASIGWTRERGEELQADTVNLQARGLIQLLLSCLHQGLRQGPQPEALSDLEKRALLLISGWEHDEKADSAGALLWQQWYTFLLEGIFRPQMGLRLFDQFVATRCAIPVVDRLLARVAAGEVSPWLSNEGEHGLPRIALRAFRRAVALLAAKHGCRPEQWAWGKEHKVRFVHPLSRRFKWLAPFLDLGPYPASGSHSTIYHNSFSLLDPFAVGFASPYRRVVDMGLPEEAVDISAPGVSGHPLSPFFTDQFTTWQKARYAPQPMRHSEIRRFPRLLLNPPLKKSDT